MLRLTFFTTAGESMAPQIPVIIFDGAPILLGPDMPFRSFRMPGSMSMNFSINDQL
jgi:hypothetical protein